MWYILVKIGEEKRKKFKKMIFTLLLALLVLPVLNAVSVDVKTEEELFSAVKNVGNDLNNVPLYGSGVDIWNIVGGEYIGKSAIGVKSGKFVINDGVFTANGERKTGTLYGNGMYSTGSAI